MCDQRDTKTRDVVCVFDLRRCGQFGDSRSSDPAPCNDNWSQDTSHFGQGQRGKWIVRKNAKLLEKIDPVCRDRHKQMCNHMSKHTSFRHVWRDTCHWSPDDENRMFTCSTRCRFGDQFVNFDMKVEFTRDKFTKSSISVMKKYHGILSWVAAFCDKQNPLLIAHVVSQFLQSMCWHFGKDSRCCARWAWICSSPASWLFIMCLEAFFGSRRRTEKSKHLFFLISMLWDGSPFICFFLWLAELMWIAYAHELQNANISQLTVRITFDDRNMESLTAKFWHFAKCENASVTRRDYEFVAIGDDHQRKIKIVSEYFASARVIFNKFSKIDFKKKINCVCHHWAYLKKCQWQMWHVFSNE